jgi:hypothetical protein
VKKRFNIKNIWFYAALLLLIFCCNACYYNPPDFDDKPGARYGQNQNMAPYNNWVNELRQTDEKRYQEYILLRKHIDSNQMAVMYRLQALQDSTMLMQYSNHQQVVSLRREIYRLTNTVYAILLLMLLGLGYLIFEKLKKRKKKYSTQTITYKPVEDATPAVIMPNSDEE